MFFPLVSIIAWIIGSTLHLNLAECYITIKFRYNQSSDNKRFSAARSSDC
jgi:hypothetical protein